MKKGVDPKYFSEGSESDTEKLDVDSLENFNNTEKIFQYLKEKDFDNAAFEIRLHTNPKNAKAIFDEIILVPKPLCWIAFLNNDLLNKFTTDFNEFNKLIFAKDMLSFSKNLTTKQQEEVDSIVVIFAKNKIWREWLGYNYFTVQLQSNALLKAQWAFQGDTSI